jgi:hypothetical protein
MLSAGHRRPDRPTPAGIPHRRSRSRGFGPSLLAGFVIAAAVTGAARLLHGLRPTLGAAPATTAANAPASTGASTAGSTSAAVIAEPVDASIVDITTTHDVAVIKISGVSGLTTIPIGDSSEPGMGDGVGAVGNALRGLNQALAIARQLSQAA